jgi:hypothetical protein
MKMSKVSRDGKLSASIFIASSVIIDKEESQALRDQGPQEKKPTSQVTHSACIPDHLYECP